MKKILYILLTGIVLYPAYNSFPQSRNVYWIHGMGGNAESLEPHDTYFKNIYQMTTSRPYVSTSFGILGAAERLVPLVHTNSQNNNILIAHSMGGVNSVWLHKIGGGSQRVGGLISLGGPFSGAIVANNIDNGILDELITEGVDKGTKGIRSEIGIFPPWMSLPPMVDAIYGLFGAVFPSSLLELMNGLAHAIFHKEIDELTQSAATRNSLKTGSSDINTIKNHSFSVPSIALYGVEDYPATLRLISSRLNKNVTGLVNNVYQTCAATSAMHSTQATLCLATGQIPLYILHRRLASDWAVSRDYWNGGIQAATDVLTGCYRTNTVTETYEEWIPDAICDDGIPYHNPGKAVAPNPICTSGHWETVTVTRTVIINEPGDGLLPITTQQAMPGCLKTVEMLHINHEEMKDHADVQAHLNRIFAGTTFTDRNPDFFRLTRR